MANTGAPPGATAATAPSAPGGRPRAASSEHDRALRAVERGEALPLSEVLPRMEQRFDARVIDATLRQARGGLVYELKMLSENGRVFVVSIDASTGRPNR